MFDPLSLILEAGKTILDLFGKVQIKNTNRREKVADYLSEIAKTINDAAQVFKEDKIPHGSCATMEQLAKLLPESIGDFIGKPESIKLQEKLLRAHNIETFMYEIPKKNKKERDASVAKMEQAAGFFEATASSLRASG
jgi:hypothetical protein